MTTDSYANGMCTFGEDRAPGAGCIKPAGHDGAHLVTPGDTSELDDDRLCPALFPGDEFHAGQLCERERGHGGDHWCMAPIAGTRHRRQLAWPAA